MLQVWAAFAAGGHIPLTASATSGYNFSSEQRCQHRPSWLHQSVSNPTFSKQRNNSTLLSQKSLNTDVFNQAVCHMRGAYVIEHASSVHQPKPKKEKSTLHIISFLFAFIFYHVCLNWSIYFTYFLSMHPKASVHSNM